MDRRDKKLIFIVRILTQIYMCILIMCSCCALPLPHIMANYGNFMAFDEIMISPKVRLNDEGVTT